MGGGVEQVHVASATAAEACLAAEDLGGHASQVHAVGNREVVGAVGRGQCVVDREVRAHAGCDGLLAGGQVHLTRHEPLADVEPRSLVGVVLAKDGFLVGPAQDHRRVELETGLGVEHVAGSELVGGGRGLGVRRHDDLQMPGRWWRDSASGSGGGETGTVVPGEPAGHCPA